MYTKVLEVIDDIRKEGTSTHKILSALTDESLETKVWKNGRSLGFIAWHIVLTLGEMGEKIGIQNDAPPLDAPMPDKADEIAHVYKKAIDSTADFIEKNWTDDSLLETQNLYGEVWENRQTLDILIRHEIHHRGQLTVLMRQAGLKVPGIYGPSLEEWDNFKMPPQP